MMRRTSFPSSRANPITSGASAATLRLYRNLIDMGRRYNTLLGTSDHFADMSAGMPLFGSEAAFVGNSGGRKPALMCYEYHDPQWLNRYGQAGTDKMAQLCRDAHAKGQIVVLHNHSGNPVNGTLDRNGQTYMYPGGLDPAAGYYNGTGYVYDMLGSPVTAVLAGGAQEAQHLAYLDRLAAFITALAPQPIILRIYHESGGGWFWWDAEGDAQFVQLWRKTVAYLRDVKGLTNVLYSWNGNTGDDFRSAYPGDAWCDLATLDFYNNAANPTFVTSNLTTAWDRLVGMTSTKPLMLAEMGARQHLTRPAYWTDAQQHLPKLKRCAAAVLWRDPWGPATSDSAASKAAFASLANDPRILTL